MWITLKGKKGKSNNVAIAAIAVVIIGAILTYNYSVEQTRQKGLQFGMELERIQEDVKRIQDRFYSEKARWEENDITKEELLAYYEEHTSNFKDVISRYDDLDPPKLFESSVELLKMSSQTQLESDTQFIKWIKTGDESAKVRSDIRIQESLDYEMQGLVEFYSAKTGVKDYNESEKFEAPQSGLTQRVIQVAEDMKKNCDERFKNESGKFDSDDLEAGWSDCTNKAQRWKIEHLP